MTISEFVIKFLQAAQDEWVILIAGIFILLGIGTVINWIAKILAWLFYLIRCGVSGHKTEQVTLCTRCWKEIKMV